MRLEDAQLGERCFDCVESRDGMIESAKSTLRFQYYRHTVTMTLVIVEFGSRFLTCRVESAYVLTTCEIPSIRSVYLDMFNVSQIYQPSSRE